MKYFPITIIDDFYENPNDILKLAKEVDYQKEGKAAIVAVFKWNGVVHPYVPPGTKPTPIPTSIIEL